MSNIAEIIRHFPQDLQDPMLQFWETMKEEIGGKREDFIELKSIVHDLAVSQNRTEQRLEELADAQNRTELCVKELAIAQNRTEQRLGELAAAQKDTERSLQHLSKTIDFKIGGLGSRWGIDSERSFRRGLAEILAETGYEVFNYVENDSEGFVFGSPAVIEIDIIVKGEQTMVVEITSSISRSDLYVFMRKAAFYEKISGRRPDRMLIITPFIDDQAREVAEKNNIVVCDSISDLGNRVKNV